MFLRLWCQGQNVENSKDVKIGKVWIYQASFDHVKVGPTPVLNYTFCEACVGKRA